jgi:hypothetical protein
VADPNVLQQLFRAVGDEVRTVRDRRRIVDIRNAELQSLGSGRARGVSMAPIHAHAMQHVL